MNLKEKLDRYSGTTRVQPPLSPAPAPSLLAHCEHVVHIFPQHHRHGNNVVEGLGGRFPFAGELLLPEGNKEALDFENIAFIDTETTGLSGGVGVCAFLVGIGYQTQEGFVVEQFLMHDFPAEPAMLQAVCKKVQDFPFIASYNGRSFDVPILEGRLVLNALAPALGRKPHLDLLHPARRLWKRRLNDCSLKSLEKNILGWQREDDIEGWLIPETYFRYLRTGNKCLLERILLHNRLDLLSLAFITHLVLKSLDFPAQAPLEHGEDWYGLGAFLEHFRRCDHAVSCYVRAMAAGLSDELSGRCRQSLALIHKRAGNWNDAVSLWEQSAARPNGSGTWLELEELAKYFEHQRKDFLSAREICRQAIGRLEIANAFSQKDALDCLTRFEHRLGRIERKLKKERACAEESSYRHSFFQQ